jgi:hypothetical protein
MKVRTSCVVYGNVSASRRNALLKTSVVNTRSAKRLTTKYSKVKTTNIRKLPELNAEARRA